MTAAALLGGSPAVTIDQTDANRWPVITNEDESAVLDVIRSGELSIHPVTRELEPFRFGGLRSSWRAAIAL